MKNARPIRGKYYIADLISQGEHEHQDFKFAISDARKIAHSISAFANNDGGRLLIGVKDNGTVAGVRNDEDIYVVEQAATMYCTPPQQVRFTSFVVEGGAIVIRAEIDRAERRPVSCVNPDGSLKAYYRVADENLPASPLMVRAWEASVDDNSDTLLGHLETAIISLIDNREGLTAERAAIALHASRASVEDAIVKLYGMGLVDFAHIEGEFRVVATPDDAD